jgi:hypothetical protein
VRCDAIAWDGSGDGWGDRWRSPPGIFAVPRRLNPYDPDCDRWIETSRDPVCSSNCSIDSRFFPASVARTMYTMCDNSQSVSECAGVCTEVSTKVICGGVSVVVDKL